MEEILYKKTSTGKIQQWSMDINKDNPSQYRTISGQLGGKLVFSDWKTATPKNVGKTNETTGEEQTLLEIKSQYKKKLEKDYHESLEDAYNQGSKIFKPMLAYEYEKLGKRDIFKNGSVSVQPKLNGMRCIATKYGLFTRNGKDIISCPHIINELKSLFEYYPDMILDGELYNHELKDNFEELMSILKKKENITPSDIGRSYKNVKYYVYDFPSIEGGYFKRFTDGLNKMDKLVPQVKVIRTQTQSVDSQEELDKLYECLGSEYEGMMIRCNNTPYENKRSWSLIKRKDFFDEEYELVDIQEGQGNWSGKAKKAILINSETGETFGAGITGTMEFCEELLKNKDKYIGKPTTVNYQAKSTTGIPLFGRCKEFNRMDN